MKAQALSLGFFVTCAIIVRAHRPANSQTVPSIVLTLKIERHTLDLPDCLGPVFLWPGGVAVNISACHAEDRGFESHPGRHSSVSLQLSC